MNAALKPPEAAAYLGTSPAQLKRWRAKGGGPKFLRYGPHLIVYRVADLDAWIRSLPAFGSIEEEMAS